MAAPVISFSPHWIAVILSTLSILGTAYAYTTHLEQRISVIETQQSDDTKHLDHIDQQVDKLVEWALGHK